HVTGVQTCALPISATATCRSGAGAATGEELAAMGAPTVAAPAPLLHGLHPAGPIIRPPSQPVRPKRTRVTAMDIAADELLLELERIELTLDEAAHRAGQGCDPEFERRLGAHLRSLRGMLDPDHVPVVADAMEAAERAMNAADPQAPLMMLRICRDNLSALVRRVAASRLRPAA